MKITVGTEEALDFGDKQLNIRDRGKPFYDMVLMDMGEHFQDEKGNQIPQNMFLWMLRGKGFTHHFLHDC
jgi:hypothetical protein